MSHFHFIHTNPTRTGPESKPEFRSQKLAINQLEHGTSLCLINDCDTKEVHVRGIGGKTLVDGGERLDARSESLILSNSVAGMRLIEGWMIPVGGLGTVG